jgi:peptidoglycan hydrolase CwlO-like protein
MPASAQTSGDVAAAQRRVNELEARISQEQSSARALQTELRGLASTVGRELGGLERIRGDLATTNKQAADAKARIAELRAKIRSRIRDVYKRGPLSVIGVFLDAKSIGQFVLRASYAARLAQRDSQVLFETRVAEAKLRAIQARQARLEREQTTRVSTLRSRQNALTDTFARQQAVLARLAHSRAEALQLVATLASKLGSGLAGLRRVAGQGMTVSYGEWAQSLLSSVGAPVVRSNLVAVVAWEASEGTMATWNPLATTYAMPGASVYNSSGVRNYLSKGQGIDATIATLHRPGHGYDAILASLKSGREAMKTGRAINASDWCRGCAGGSYVVGFIPAVERYYERYAG